MIDRRKYEFLFAIFLILAETCFCMTPFLIPFPILLIFGLLFTALFVILALICRKYAQREYEKEQIRISQQPTHSTVTPQNDLQDGTKNYNLLSDIVDDSILKYEYENNFFLFGNGVSYLSGNGGKDLEFVQEPENEYDNKAVAIYLNEHKIGYVYRGGIQDMINDWIKRGHYFRGYLNRFSVAEKKATFKIGFYKPLSLYPCKTFSLVKTSKKADEFTKRSEYLSCCSEGESISVEYDSYSETFVVFSDTYQEIGELPAGANNFLSGVESDEIVGIIDTLEDEYESNPKAKVKIYIIK